MVVLVHKYYVLAQFHLRTIKVTILLIQFHPELSKCILVLKFFFVAQLRPSTYVERCAITLAWSALVAPLVNVGYG
jgi:hypothetical protein